MAQTSAFEVCGLTGLIRHGAPTRAAQISTHWQWWWCPSLPVGPPLPRGGTAWPGQAPALHPIFGQYGNDPA